MTTQDQMTVDERRTYLRHMKKRYQQANRQEQGQLLTEMAQVTDLHRKSLIRLLNSDLSCQPRRGERGRLYDVQVDDALRVIAESFDHLCAERLTPNLVWMAEQLARHGELALSEHLRQQLGQISVSTVGRILKRINQDQPRLPHKGPEQANKVSRDIPMKRIAWDQTEAGHFETDLVHHCGPEASGQYLHPLQLIDVATGWSERVAVLGRSYVVMADAFSRMVERLPFPVHEIHPDNGSEFLNHHLVRFFRETIKGRDIVAIHVDTAAPNPGILRGSSGNSRYHSRVAHDPIVTKGQSLKQEISGENTATTPTSPAYYGRVLGDRVVGEGGDPAKQGHSAAIPIAAGRVSPVALDSVTTDRDLLAPPGDTTPARPGD